MLFRSEDAGRLVIRSAGGGGFGDPLQRPVADVVRDVRDEVVSVDAAAQSYGVVMAADGATADSSATTARRDALRAACRIDAAAAEPVSA